LLGQKAVTVRAVQAVRAVQLARRARQARQAARARSMRLAAAVVAVVARPRVLVLRGAQADSQAVAVGPVVRPSRATAAMAVQAQRVRWSWRSTDENGYRKGRRRH